MGREDAIVRAIEQVQHLAALFGKRRAQLAERVELTEAQWRVLEGVATRHFMPSLFADGHDQSRGAVSKILKQLQDKNLIEASISADDGRNRKYELTAQGARSCEELRALRRQAVREVWSDLPPADLDVFNRLCEQLIENLRRYSEKETAQEDGRSTRRRKSSQRGS